MVDEIRRKIAELEDMTAGQLRERYAEVFGEASRSANRQWLFRRIAWRLQAQAEGDLAIRAMERVRARAGELARDADIRLRPPAREAVEIAEKIVVGRPQYRDERVPPPGAVLKRAYKGKEHRVRVLTEGFEYGGRPFRSLSAVAHAITGTHWNGLHFFGLKGNKR